ncbi:MAG TPA: cytochrome c oxidase assembly protein [Acetobacteraceae bacterium]|nr:cytochrome c oxidase assembly protein [Acetobacteraceae bacterium]
MASQRTRQTLLVGSLLAAIGVMTTLVCYSVTLYRLFCAATGANGTTQRAAAAPGAAGGRLVTVAFDTNIAPGLPWRFRPEQRSVRLPLGQDTVVFFSAENLSDQDIVGHATFNVTPAKAGIYFKKIQCFCFTEERLGAHQKVEMPVDFFVDPRLATDPGTADVQDITLSYTFFRSRAPGQPTDLARFASAPPDPVAGGKIFAAQCAGCHALDVARVGPPLRGVVGRRAGSVAHFPYSAALARSDLVWSEASLDRWLAGPAAFLPGALMPANLPDPAARRDVIAWLRQARPPAPPAPVPPGGRT